MLVLDLWGKTKDIVIRDVKNQYKNIEWYNYFSYNAVTSDEDCDVSTASCLSSCLHQLMSTGYAPLYIFQRLAVIGAFWFFIVPHVNPFHCALLLFYCCFPRCSPIKAKLAWYKWQHVTSWPHDLINILKCWGPLHWCTCMKILMKKLIIFHFDIYRLAIYRLINCI